MAVIPMPIRSPRVKALRPEDRVEREPRVRAHGLTGLIVGTAIVAGCVAGLFLYDAGRPIASGAMPPPLPLIIAVEPAPADPAQLR